MATIPDPSEPRRADATTGGDDMVIDYGAAGEGAPRTGRTTAAPDARTERTTPAPDARTDRVGGATAPGATATGATTSGAASRTTDAATTREPTQVRLDPSLDAHQRQGITGGTWIALILGTVILILLLIFILQNNVPASFAYFGWEFGLPLGIAMLFAAIAGVLITALLGSVRMFRLSRRVRKLEKERAEIKRALR